MDVGTEVDGSSNLFRSIEERGSLGIKVSSPTHSTPTEVGSKLVRRFSRKNIEEQNDVQNVEQNVDQNIDQNVDKKKRERKKSVWFREDPVHSDIDSDEARFTFRSVQPEKQVFKLEESSDKNQIFNPDNPDRKDQNVPGENDEIKKAESEEYLTFKIDSTNHSDASPIVKTTIHNIEEDENFEASESEKHFQLSSFKTATSSDKISTSLPEDFKLNSTQEDPENQISLKEENLIFQTIKVLIPDKSEGDDKISDQNQNDVLKSNKSEIDDKTSDNREIDVTTLDNSEIDNNTFEAKKFLQLDLSAVQENQEFEFFPSKFEDDSTNFQLTEEEVVFQKQEDELILSQSNQIEKEKSKAHHTSENQFESNFLPDEIVFSSEVKEETNIGQDSKEVYFENDDTLDSNKDAPKVLLDLKDELKESKKETVNDFKAREEPIISNSNEQSSIDLNRETKDEQEYQTNQESFGDFVQDVNEKSSNRFNESNPEQVDPIENPESCNSGSRQDSNNSEENSAEEKLKQFESSKHITFKCVEDQKSFETSDSSEDSQTSEENLKQFQISENIKDGEIVSKHVTFEDENQDSFESNEDLSRSEVFTKWDPDKVESVGIKNDPFDVDNPFSDFKLGSSQPVDPWGNPSSDQPVNPVSFNFEQDQFFPHFETPIEAVTFSAKPFERYFEHSDNQAIFLETFFEISFLLP